MVTTDFLLLALHLVVDLSSALLNFLVELIHKLNESCVVLDLCDPSPVSVVPNDVDSLLVPHILDRFLLLSAAARVRLQRLGLLGSLFLVHGLECFLVPHLLCRLISDQLLLLLLGFHFVKVFDLILDVVEDALPYASLFQ